jgi:hypothetical protein
MRPKGIMVIFYNVRLFSRQVSEAYSRLTLAIWSLIRSSEKQQKLGQILLAPTLVVIAQIH